MSRKSSSPAAPKTMDKDEKPGLGWPGYRTREGRTGWDPIDADNEAAHMTGTILSRLFHGRIQNPIWLLLLGLLGALLVSPLVLSMIGLINGDGAPSNDWLFAILAGGVGVVILVNFTKNLIANLSR